MTTDGATRLSSPLPVVTDAVGPRLLIRQVSEQFLNGTSAHRRPFQCHAYSTGGHAAYFAANLHI